MVGAVLFIEHNVLGYYSKKLSATKRNYSIVEKEFFAIFKELQFYENIIEGFYIEVITDNLN